jgi:hypothetical protein
MGRGKDYPVSVAALIRGAIPRHAAKEIEQHVGCSRRQAWRIVSTGRVPQRFRAALIALLRDAADRNERRLRELKGEIQLLEYRDQVEARQAARETPMGPDR